MPIHSTATATAADLIRFMGEGAAIHIPSNPHHHIPGHGLLIKVENPPNAFREYLAPFNEIDLFRCHLQATKACPSLSLEAFQSGRKPAGPSKGR